jgi:hypothetical protein
MAADNWQWTNGQKGRSARANAPNRGCECGQARETEGQIQRRTRALFQMRTRGKVSATAFNFAAARREAEGPRGRLPASAACEHEHQARRGRNPPPPA